MQSDDVMLEELEQRDLGFLCPLLQMKRELSNVIESAESAETVLTWISSHVDGSVQKTSSFIEVVGAWFVFGT
jgi:hypothetical protein